jgi:polar amino acid transport system substrate-binding protein
MMLKFKYFRIITLLFFYLAGTTYAQEHAVKTSFTACYESLEQFPYYIGNSEIISSKPGVSIDLLRLVADELNLDLKLSRTPWKRCLANLENGIVDGAFNASFLTERMAIARYPMHENTIDVSRRLIMLDYSLYILKNSSLSWDGKKFINLGSISLGAPLGYSIVTDLKKMKVPVIESATSIKLLNQLLGKQVVGVVLQTVTGDYLIKNEAERFSSIVKVDPPISSKPYYLMISHKFADKNQELSEKIWNSIAKFREIKLQGLIESYN